MPKGNRVMTLKDLEEKKVKLLEGAEANRKLAEKKEEAAAKLQLRIDAKLNETPEDLKAQQDRLKKQQEAIQRRLEEMAQQGSVGIEEAQEESETPVDRLEL